MQIVTDRDILKKESKKVGYPEIPGIEKSFNYLTKIMLSNEGCGLAAPQIDDNRRYFIAEIRGIPRLFINPEIIWVSDTMNLGTEGCLSVPNENGTVQRHDVIKLKYMKHMKKGYFFVTEQFVGLSARIIQHELDHLNGILFTDRLYESEVKKEIVV